MNAPPEPLLPPQAADWLRTALDGASAGVLVQDAQGVIVDLNPAAARMMGLPRECIVGRRSADPDWVLFDADGQPLPPEQRPLMQTLRTGRPLRDQVMGVRHEAGGIRWLQIDTNPVARADGTQWTVSSFIDITARRRAEEVLARHHGLMHALFELSPLGLQLIDIGTGKVEAVNDALVAITGYSRHELLHGDGRARFPAHAQPVRAGWFAEAAAHGRFGPSEVDYLHGSGRIVQLLFHGVRITDPRHAGYLWLSVQDVTERRAMERELRAAASEDRLTGLANRATMLAALQRRLQAAHEGATPAFGVMFLDFDRFKQVNDTLGHDGGDTLLKAIAGRLRATAGDGWTVARFGGDEFVILLPALAGPGGEDDAARQADALLAALAEPYPILGQEVHSTASIGIALWHPGIDSAEALLRDADAAMYEAKRAGRGRWVRIDDAMRRRLDRALTIESELRHAAARGQLSAAYQPIVDLASGAMTSVEALLRWRHPVLGEVSPAEFIPIAEESRLILALGEWILREACRQWAAWQRQDPARAPPVVSVNLSRVQMTLGMRLPELLRAALAEAGMPPAALQLEVTEREVMKDPAQSRQVMQAIAALGIRLAMDDFGTGTSSLGCLRDYPFHTIKIDKSFVTGLFRDPHVLAVAHATINVIENLGMVSVAEGIEDPIEVATLQGLGCRLGQGHHFAPALPPDQVLELACAGRVNPA